MSRSTVALSLLVAIGISAGPALAASGNASHYTLAQKSQDYRTNKMVTTRWNPCVSISYKINPGTLGATGVSEVKAGIARLAANSGLRFSYAGTTSYVPRAHSQTDGPQTSSRWDVEEQRDRTQVNLVVAWTKRGGSNLYSGSELGQGGWQMESSSERGARITDGYALLRADGGLKPGFGTGTYRGGLILHELGHAVGLDHYSDAIMIMNPGVGQRTPPNYNNGDIAGLKKVGAPAGCIQ